MRSIFSDLLFLIIGLMLSGVFIAAHVYVYLAVIGVVTDKSKVLLLGTASKRSPC